MSKEIERKFLVHAERLPLQKGLSYRQGYLNTDKHRTVRVRTIGRQGFLTIKGLTTGCSRNEYEYPVPFEDATEMLDQLCEKPLIEKERITIKVAESWFEVDVFHGENEGLIVAEIELNSEEEAFPRPDWLGQEVTGESRYYNSNLIQCPYSSWHK